MIAGSHAGLIGRVRQQRSKGQPIVNDSPSQNLPLSDIRVLEFTHAVMGPAAGLVLADLGAEVIRIEPAPEGDPTRRLKGFGTGYFTFFNRNKKSLAVNLKTEEGQRIVRDLVNTADVLIENFAPGTIDRLGFGYEAVSEINPRLIFCSLKGFMAGPYEKRPALDEVVQMMSGLAYMTGPRGRPLRAGASIVDIMGGTYGAMAVLVALRERERTGRGTRVMNGLFETAAFIMGQHMAYSAIAQEALPPMPDRVSAWAIYRTFETAEGDLVFVGVTSDKHWERFCTVFGREDLLNDPSLASNNDRISQRDWLLPALERLFMSMPKAKIVAKCDEAEIPFSPIARPEDLFTDPQLNEGGTLLDVALPDGSSTRLPRLPLWIEGEDLGLRLDPPAVGAHTRALLAELGYSAEQIDSLADNGIVALKNL
jgi:crotonobetainyl-CoA:carnitine CoA-transferase CaiB-like acyl-CoA transferase